MPEKRTRNISAKAKELLFADENYVTLILSVIIFALAGVLPIVALYMMSELVDQTILSVGFLAVEILTVAPLFFGLIRISGLASKKADMGLLDIFFAFDSVKNYLRILLLTLVSILRITTPLSIGFILARLAISTFNITGMLSMISTVVLMLLVYALFLPLNIRLYAVNFLVAADGEKIASSIRRSWEYTSKSTVFLLAYSIKMLPLLIASVAAICVPLVIYTIPFLLCAYSISCRKLIILKQNDICPEEKLEGVEEINEQDSE